MASPQVEDGHTRIANEILQALMRMYIPPNQRQVLDCIMRRTWGFQKKTDKIANTQIAEDTGLLPSTVSRALIRLEQQKIITRHKRLVGIQKDWERWEVSSAAINSSPANSEAENSSPANSEEIAAQPSKDSSPAMKKIAAQLSTKERVKDTLSKESDPGKPRGEFQNVYLTDEQIEKLRSRYPAQVDRAVEELSAYCRSKGKTYKDYYATLLNWIRRNEQDGKARQTRHPRLIPTTYEPSRKYPDD